jgi:hypothetical protein
MTVTKLSREDTMQAITDGVALALIQYLADVDIAGAVEAGVKDAFDQLWPSQIADAISNGVRQARLGG